MATSCSFCFEDLPSDKGLQEHQQHCHVVYLREELTEVEEVKPICDSGDIKQEVTTVLEDNNEETSGSTPVLGYTCGVCEKGFNKRCYLTKHMKMHTGEKNYSCDVCKKTFGANYEVVRHMRTHTGEKPYSCEVCHRKFTFRQSRIQHMRTHTGERPFSCEFCKESFTRAHAKRQHVRRHTGEKPFACKIVRQKVHTSE